MRHIAALLAALLTGTAGAAELTLELPQGSRS